MTAPKQTPVHRHLLAALAGTAFAVGTALAQSPAIPPSLITPDKVETRIGTLDFKDGAPNQATLDKVYDNLLFTHAYNAFINTFQGVSMSSFRDGIVKAGVKDGEFIIWPKLLDSKALFATANADTVYFFGFADLSKGPVVFEAPPGALGVIDDMWWRWVSDFGAPGPDRGLGGKYLLVPPGYKGQLPKGGFIVVYPKTLRVGLLGRAFMQNNDPKPAVETIRKFTKVYPYEVGGVGTPIAEFLTGKARLGRISPPPPLKFHDGTGLAINTMPPNDWSFYEVLNDLVQQEPATVLNPELMGSIAAIGIVKGKPFAPDARTKNILTEALALANATSRSLFMNPRDKSWFLYPDSAWQNMLFVTGSEFETPIPEITREGVKPFPPTGYRTLDARTAFFYYITGISPAMAMRLPGVGSQYCWATVDSDKNYLDGGKTYKVTLPKGIPAEKFWSFTLYDTMTRSMLDTPQRYPRAGSQSFPTPAAEASADGTTTVYFGPTQPKGVKRGNWIQTMPGKGFFPMLRLYSPLEPFFTQQWRPSEVELVK
ncbi:DUF1254 domain-containing protein [Accumulibacter sp.]|uniref:DUF1254 domain-containing protein n=1 Tax=Accumulibacter sp. TaxID=2053492 RepID=UPI0028C46062|nr:DUF1254 domain-containing protein [Accumulibacter sp.]